MKSEPKKTGELKVLFVHTRLYIGGEENQNLVTFKRMEQDGFRFVVVTLKDEGEMAWRYREAGIKTYSKTLRHKYDVLVLPRLIRIIRRERPDIVCTAGFGDSFFWGRLAAWLAGVRVIVSTFFTFGILDRSGKFIDRFNEWLFPVTTRIKTSSIALRDYLVQEMGFPADKMAVVHDGVDTARFERAFDRAGIRRELGIAPDALVVGMAASLHSWKGPDIFVKAAIEVLKGFPGAFFVLAGDGPEMPNLKRLAAESGFADRILLVGFRKDIDALYSIFDIVLLTSYTEAFPNTLLEAMASTLPVVSSAVGGAVEIVLDGETGFLVPAGEPGAFAEKVLVLLNDRALRESMGRAGRLRIETEFSLDKKAEKFGAFFRDLAAASKREGRR